MDSPLCRAFATIAHRGNSALAPENTFAAFDLALTTGPAFELDVQLTSDGVCIVLHDEVLGRTNVGEGRVAETSWEALSTLDAGSWLDPKFASCRIPTLTEVLMRYRNRAHIHLELKSQQPGLAQAVKEALTSTGWLSDLQHQHQHQRSSPAPEDGADADAKAPEQPDEGSARWRAAQSLQCVPGLTLTSFHLSQLVQSMRIMPGLTHGWLVQELDGAVLEAARAAGITQLCPRVNACSAERVDAALRAGFSSVRGWGVKTPDLLRAAAAAGMHGATVNWPHECEAALGH